MLVALLPHVMSINWKEGTDKMKKMVRVGLELLCAGCEAMWAYAFHVALGGSPA